MKSPKNSLNYMKRQAQKRVKVYLIYLMDGRIEESMSSIVEIELIETNTRKLIFSDKGYHAGMEVAGDIKRILK